MGFESWSLVEFLILFGAAVLFFTRLRRLHLVGGIAGLLLISSGFALLFAAIALRAVVPAPPSRGTLIAYVFIETSGLLLVFFGMYRGTRSLVPHLSAYYTSLVEHSLVGVYVIQNGVFKFVNAQFAKIFGYERRELFGKSVLELVAEGSRPVVAENIRLRIQGEADTLHYEFTGLMKSGDTVDVEVYGSRIDYEGQPAIHGTLLDISDRKRADETLRNSETRFRMVVEGLAEAIVITDAEDNIMYANGRMTELSGYSIGEILGSTSFKLLFPKEEWERIANFTQRRLTGISETYASRLRRKDGTILDIEIHASPYRDGDGMIVGTLAAITDITIRREAERLREALYKITEQSSSAADLGEFHRSIHMIVSELLYARNFYIALHDSSTDVISFPYFVDEYDTPPPPMRARCGLTEYVIRTGAMLHVTAEESKSMLERGEIELIGEPAVEWLGVPLTSRGKTFGAIVVQSYTPAMRFSARDEEILTFVSRNIASAIQRKADEERFRAVWEHSADGMRLTDREGHIVMVNSAYCALVMMSAEQLVGKTFSVTYGRHDPGQGIDLYHERFDRGTVLPRVLTNLTLWNMREIWVEISNSFVAFGPNEKMLLSIFRDVTDRKRLEEQLMHAQKMESIGVLAGGIAHDFNNVLSMILGAAELLKKKSTSTPPLARYAEMIATAAERGAGIARQLLLFAHSEKATLRPMKLSDLVEEIGRLLEHSLPKSISVRTVSETGDTSVLGDVDQLHHAILNLALNARDAIIAGTGTGTITFRLFTCSGNEARQQFANAPSEIYRVLSVCDNGIGMDAATQKRIFEPFFSTKQRGKGTGLGMSIAHGVIQNHSGLINVESEPGKGTTISVFIPAAHDASRSNAERPSAGREQPGGAHTILMVDDEPMLRAMLKESLEEAGYRVLCAANGAEAVELYRQQHASIDIVVTDLGMPAMGGEEAFRRMKEINPEIIALFATGYVEQERTIDEYYAEGIRGIIRKPFRMEEILSTLRSILGESPRFPQ